MKTIIVPGFSSKNKDWALETQKNIPGAEIYEWPHWKDLSIKFKPKEEAKKILELIGETEINIIAKSIGTLVASIVIKNAKLNKIIYAGIPVNDMNEDDLYEFKILSDIDPAKVTVFQNSEDEHGSFVAVRKFLSQINPNIEIKEKPGKTHDYSYYEEFKEFLK
jgi:hypothetical protein